LKSGVRSSETTPGSASESTGRAVHSPSRRTSGASSGELFFPRFACRIGFKLYFASCRVLGVENLPSPETPFILAINHRSILDPGLIWSYFPEPVYFLYREDFGGFDRFPLLGWAVRKMQQVPIVRGEGDVKGVKIAIRYLREERRNLAIFIEGSRGEGDGMQPGKDGCALIAGRAGAPVVPAYLDGLGMAFPRGSMVPTYTRDLTIRIGKPIQIARGDHEERREVLRGETQRIVQAIEALAP